MRSKNSIRGLSGRSLTLCALVFGAGLAGCAGSGQEDAPPAAEKTAKQTTAGPRIGGADPQREAMAVRALGA